MKKITTANHFVKIVNVLTNELTIRLQTKVRFQEETTNGNRQYHSVDGTFLFPLIKIHYDPSTVNIGLTLIHEVVHHLYPDWPEQRVRRFSEKLFCGFSSMEIKVIEAFITPRMIQDFKKRYSTKRKKKKQTKGNKPPP